MSVIRYVRVGLRSQRKPVYLRVVSETDKFLSGYEVDAKEGEEIQPKGYGRRLRVIGQDMIRSVVEMEMDKTYATLKIKAGEALPPPGPTKEKK